MTQWIEYLTDRIAYCAMLRVLLKFDKQASLAHIVTTVTQIIF